MSPGDSRLSPPTQEAEYIRTQKGMVELVSSFSFGSCMNRKKELKVQATIKMFKTSLQDNNHSLINNKVSALETWMQQQQRPR